MRKKVADAKVAELLNRYGYSRLRDMCDDHGIILATYRNRRKMYPHGDAVAQLDPHWKPHGLTENIPIAYCIEKHRPITRDTIHTINMWLRKGDTVKYIANVLDRSPELIKSLQGVKL